MLVLLHGEKDETAVLDMMERMYLREEIEVRGSGQAVGVGGHNHSHTSS